MRSRNLVRFLAIAIGLTPAIARAQTPPPSIGADIVLDPLSDNVGIAQRIARERGLEGRILWIDAGANIGNLNSVEKIHDIVQKAKTAGINMIVLDVKPIVGETIYPSKFAPRLTEWKGQKVDPSLDVLQTVLTECHAVGLPVYANMSTFGEGHKFVQRGLAYTHPDWQTTLYEVDRSVRRQPGGPIPISVENAAPRTGATLGVWTNNSVFATNRPGAWVVVTNLDARVVAALDGGALKGSSLSIPPRGAALVGTGQAADWLRHNAPVGAILT